MQYFLGEGICMGDSMRESSGESSSSSREGEEKRERIGGRGRARVIAPRAEGGQRWNGGEGRGDSTVCMYGMVLPMIRREGIVAVSGMVLS